MLLGCLLSLTRFFEPNCNSDIARTVVDVGQASHPSGIPHLPPHEVSGTRDPYPPMLLSLAGYERNPTKALYPSGVPQFSRPSYNNTKIPYPPGNIFVPNNVNRNCGRGVPYSPGSYLPCTNETNSYKTPYPTRNYCPPGFENITYRFPYLSGFQAP